MRERVKKSSSSSCFVALDGFGDSSSMVKGESKSAVSSLLWVVEVEGSRGGVDRMLVSRPGFVGREEAMPLSWCVRVGAVSGICWLAGMTFETSAV